ncbi:MAG TPA: MFS transporter [Bryobacteraceae bacterium]|nr:MFS transporter [Bryobacteraceae bacterium]
MPESPVNLSAYWRLLQTNRNFRLLWFAQIVSEIGDWLYAVAIYSLILDLTGSAKSMSFAFVLQVLPQFFAAPTAGMLNDRISRRQVMLIADWSRAVTTFCMLFAQTRELLWLLYVLLFLETVFWALFEPAHTAVIPNITSENRERLVANGLASTTWSFTLAIGSALGGVLAAFFGRNAVFIINSLSFVASALLIRQMRFEEPHLADMPPMKAREMVDFSPMLEGLRYVKKDPRMLATMFVKCGLSTMGSNWVLLPIFGKNIFPVTVRGLDPRSSGMLGMSLLMGCRGIGALLGPLVASRWTGHDPGRFRLAILFAFLIGSVGYLALGLSSTLLFACAAVVFAHSGGAMAWVFSTTLLQEQTEDRFRGRVFSAEYAMSMLILSAVSYSAGVLADEGIPVRTLATWTGYLILLPALLWGLAQRLWQEKPAQIPRQAKAE